MSNKIYQVRTTYLDGTVTTDMIDAVQNDPKLTLDMYVLSAPNTFEDTQTIEILDFSSNETLYSFTFVQDLRHAA